MKFMINYYWDNLFEYSQRDVYPLAEKEKSIRKKKKKEQKNRSKGSKK